MLVIFVNCENNPLCTIPIFLNGKKHFLLIFSRYIFRSLFVYFDRKLSRNDWFNTPNVRIAIILYIELYSWTVIALKARIKIEFIRSTNCEERRKKGQKRKENGCWIYNTYRDLFVLHQTIRNKHTLFMASFNWIAITTRELNIT